AQEGGIGGRDDRDQDQEGKDDPVGAKDPASVATGSLAQPSRAGRNGQTPHATDASPSTMKTRRRIRSTDASRRSSVAITRPRARTSTLSADSRTSSSSDETMMRDIPPSA